MEQSIPVDFFKEEELCGHLVTTQIKKLWSIQLGCLQELKRICEKYDIMFFASGGTLLGAVRHKGFIPWDDDIDVMMFYGDYVRFCEYAPKEIKSPYFFQNYKTEPGFGPSMSRIRNSETTGCTKYDYAIADGKYNCGIFIDIFPLFGIDDRRIPLLLQKIKMKIWWYAIAGYESLRVARQEGWTIKRRLNPLICWWIIVSLFKSHENVSNCYLRSCSSAKSFVKMGLLSFTGFNKRLVWNKEWFEKIITLPFEYTVIPCPEAYDPILRTQYGDYMKFVKGGQIHTMVICDPDIPFKVKIADKFSFKSK